MIFRALFRATLALSFFALLAIPQPASADSSHARIIRLSLVQGDVRFTREAHGDPLSDDKAVWETAELNLPIRQGYVLATDNGRAEVEFENGAMAFLSEHTVLEFYDLSLQDGGRTTRLVLRQGTASFYVNPASADYFSVTGGDFTVEADGKTTFRLDDFDDGSNVNVLSGHVSVLHKSETTRLSKGQSLSMKAGEDAVNIGRLPNDDDFDRWVSGRVESSATSTNAALQYTDSPYYTSGFGDLYTYGSWFPCGGYGYGWRPFGVGFGWSPFTSGQWGWDPFFGWNWMSFEPWGWAPYHYGGWLFDSGCGGWFYSPPIYYYGFVPGTGRLPRRFPPGVHPPRPIFHGATAVFVRQNGQLGLVPMHPLDKAGHTPLNLQHGVFPAASANNVTRTAMNFDRSEKVETLKSAPRNALANSLVTTTPPERVSRTVIEGSSGTRVVSLGHDSAIVYDPHEHRFVNTNNPPVSPKDNTEVRSEKVQPGTAGNVVINGRTGTTVKPPGTTARVPGPPTSTRAGNNPPARTVTPPPARSGGGERATYGGGSSRGGSSWGGGGGSSRGSSAPSAPAPHPSSGGGGGKPH
jgi:hypothetical protein